MLIQINPVVQKALQEKKPVVALESTIISHGMPYPENVKTALEVERIVLENGAIPATIGIIDGVAIIGMTKEQIEQFGQRKGIVKASKRDLPIIMAQKLWGATTVATTMFFASKANIEVFVTGGIGGVHKNAQQTFDISADLQELASTNVSVVCAGAKAILDLPLTLEYLETFGVPVIGYQSDELAAFYSVSSGLKIDAAMKDEKEIAQVIYAKRKLNISGGILISNPIPAKDAIPNAVINEYIDQALKEANEKGIKGKEVTPFLLQNIVLKTKGESLKANIALIYNNAKIGARIACEYNKLQH